MQIISNMIEAHIFKEVPGGIEFLLLKRNEAEIYPGLWQMVTGKIKEGETAYQTALREIKEETGYIPDKIWVAPNVNSFYSHEKNFISLLPVFAAKINPVSDPVICEEHSECKWVEPAEARKLLAWVGQRNSIDIITQYFTEEINFLNFIEIKF
jgi:dihydroneopterin triphosphate diphosphatase